MAVGLFLEWAQCCGIKNTHLNPALAVVVVACHKRTLMYMC